MIVGDMVQQVYQDLNETGAGYFNTAKIVNALNEGYRHARHVVMRADPDGDNLSLISVATYPASTNWFLINVAAGGHFTTNGVPLKIHELRVYNSSTGRYGDPIPIVPPKQEFDYGQRSSTLYAVIRGNYIGLRLGGIAPSAAVTLAMKLTPAADAMLSTGNYPVTHPGSGLLWSAWEPPFIADHYEVIVAYATVRLAVGSDQPPGDLGARYDQLERQLIEQVELSRCNQDAPEVAITSDCEWMYVYGGR